LESRVGNLNYAVDFSFFEKSFFAAAEKLLEKSLFVRPVAAKNLFQIGKIN
jgi:hypothetical protein